eukprot:8383579-Ditylum_brightwellii.AAC.1
MTTITTRLAARKAATVEITKEAVTQQENLPEDVGHDATEQLETDDASQRDHPVRWTLPHLFPPGEAEEVNPPLPLQGSSLGSRCAGLSQQDGQDDRSQPSEDARVGQARRPELNQGNAPDCPGWQGPEPDYDGGRPSANSPGMAAP